MYSTVYCCFEFHVGVRNCLRHGADCMVGLVRARPFRIVLEVLEEAFVGRLRSGTFHFALMASRALFRGARIGRDDADEIAVADYFYSGHLFGGGGVERLRGLR